MTPGVGQNIHTCTVCIGEQVDGLPDAQRLDEVVASVPVPYTVRVGFSGCANNCGEALVRDIGIIRMDATFRAVVAAAVAVPESR